MKTCCYKVCHMVPETRTCCYKVCHMVPEQRTRTCCYKVCHMVPETGPAATRSATWFPRRGPAATRSATWCRAVRKTCCYKVCHMVPETTDLLLQGLPHGAEAVREDLLLQGLPHGARDNGPAATKSATWCLRLGPRPCATPCASRCASRRPSRSLAAFPPGALHRDPVRAHEWSASKFRCCVCCPRACDPSCGCAEPSCGAPSCD